MTAKWQYKEAYEAALVTARELRAENAKLRELVADVREALCLDKTSLFREAIIKSLEDDMRELGIEVES